MQQNEMAFSLKALNFQFHVISPKAEMLSQPLSHICPSSLWMSKHVVGGWVGNHFFGLNRLDVNTSRASLNKLAKRV